MEMGHSPDPLQASGLSRSPAALAGWDTQEAGEVRCAAARGQPPLKETSEFPSKSKWTRPIAPPAAGVELLARYSKHHIGDEAMEGLVLDELLVNLGVVFEEGKHYLGKGLVVLDAGGVRCVLLRIPIGLVGGNLGRNVIPDAAGHAVGVGEQRAEMVVKGFEDVAQAVELRLALVAAAFHRHRSRFPAII